VHAGSTGRRSSGSTEQQEQHKAARSLAGWPAWRGRAPGHLGSGRARGRQSLQGAPAARRTCMRSGNKGTPKQCCQAPNPFRDRICAQAALSMHAPASARAPEVQLLCAARFLEALEQESGRERNRSHVCYMECTLRASTRGVTRSCYLPCLFIGMDKSIGHANIEANAGSCRPPSSHVFYKHTEGAQTLSQKSTDAWKALRHAFTPRRKTPVRTCRRARARPRKRAARPASCPPGARPAHTRCLRK